MRRDENMGGEICVVSTTEPPVPRAKDSMRVHLFVNAHPTSYTTACVGKTAGR